MDDLSWKVKVGNVEDLKKAFYTTKKELYKSLLLGNAVLNMFTHMVFLASPAATLEAKFWNVAKYLVTTNQICEELWCVFLK